MTYPNQSPSTTPDVTGVVVPPPRQADAIGQALAFAFDARKGLPPDLQDALVKLDRLQ